MGRPRTPTRILEARGSFDRHPERRRARGSEPAFSGPVGEPPDYFDDSHRAVWDELVAEAPEGALQRSDGMHLELTTRLLVRQRSNPGRREQWMRSLGGLLVARGMSQEDVAEMMDEFRKALTPTPGETALLAKCLHQMGCTPAARKRLEW